MRKSKNKWLFNNEIYDSIDAVDEAISEYIVNTYPEEVHSDFMPEESSLFEDLWDEVEELKGFRL
jgi:hypothetical protein